MVQNLTYTQYGDYYIPDIRLAHMGNTHPWQIWQNAQSVLRAEQANAF